MPITRRQLLHGLGGGLIAAPFARLLTGGGTARAQGAATAKRLVVFFSPNGVMMNQWKPTGGETDFVLSPTLAPLAEHRDDLVVLNFWFTDCPPCRNEIPQLVDFHDAMLTISADANAKHQHVVTAMDVAARLGFVKVSIATISDPTD